MAIDFANPACQSSSVISVPSGLIQLMSPLWLPRYDRPWKNRRRRNTGCSWRSAINRRVNSTIASLATNRSQSNQEISLSWQYALLLPCCVRPDSSPASSLGTPCDRKRVAEVAHLPLAQGVDL